MSNESKIGELREFSSEKGYNFLTFTRIFINDPTRGYGIGIEKMIGE